MATITFDTLKCVKRLKGAGFDEPQAEAISEAFKEMQEISISELVTKQDLRVEIQSLHNEVREVELKLTAEINLLKWMMGFVLAGIVSLVLKAFFLH